MSLFYRCLSTFLSIVTHVIYILLFDKCLLICSLKLSLSSLVILSRTISWDFWISFPNRNRFTLMLVFVSNIFKTRIRRIRRTWWTRRIRQTPRIWRIRRIQGIWRIRWTRRIWRIRRFQQVRPIQLIWRIRRIQRIRRIA